MANLTSKVYSKILIARESPQNKCAGPTGDWLVPALPKDVGRSTGTLGFVGLVHRRHNRYGWVDEIPKPVTALELRGEDRRSLRTLYGDIADAVLPEVTWYESYLDDIASNKIGTPMTAGWRDVRGPGVSRRELHFHRVIFFHGTKT